MKTQTICLDELLTGQPAWTEVVEFWKKGDFCEEHYLIEAIEKHLLTEEQKAKILAANLTIEKMLNGRYSIEEEMVESIYQEWNAKLGFRSFGF
jgi:hypothetical protein